MIDDLVRRLNLAQLPCAASLLRFLPNLFISTQNAVREVYGHEPASYLPGSRSKPENHSTSWLKYITFDFRPVISADASLFLAECVNRSEISSELEGGTIALLVRVPLPLAGFEAFALTKSGSDSFTKIRDELVGVLRAAPGLQQVAAAAAFLTLQDAPMIPHRLYQWMDLFSRSDFMATNSLTIEFTESAK